MKQIFLVLLFTAFTATAQNNTSITAEMTYSEAAAKHVKAALREVKPRTWKTDAIVVPDEKVAEAIHAEVASSVFGDEKIQKQKPFQAMRSGDFWVVFGSLPPNTLGGTAVSVIRASNGEVFRIALEQ